MNAIANLIRWYFTQRVWLEVFRTTYGEGNTIDCACREASTAAHNYQRAFTFSPSSPSQKQS